MKIAVMGAGAVGCYYGGMLARAGHDVTLIGRPQHVEAMRARRPALETHDASTSTCRWPPAPTPGAVRGAPLVLFCVKSTDTESAGAQIAPHLDADALVLGLQNGVDNADRLRTVLPCAGRRRGRLRRHRDGRPRPREAPRPRRTRHRALAARSDAAAAALIAAGIPTAGLGQRARRAVGQADPQLRLQRAVGDHAAALRPRRAGRGRRGRDARRGGRVPGRRRGRRRDAAGRRRGSGAAASRRPCPAQFSSTAQDLARGKRSEIDYLNGLVVRRGEALGVATPANRVLMRR